MVGDSLAEQKSVLELERARLLATYEPSSLRVRAIDERLREVDRELLRLPVAVARQATRDVAQAFERRRVELERHIAKLRTVYTDKALVLNIAEAELQQLRTRQDELRAEWAPPGAR